MSDQSTASRSKAEPAKANGLSNSVELFVDVASDGWKDAPSMEALIRECVACVFATFPDVDAPLELSVRLTDDGDIAQLNREFRKQDKPTNVLSFPSFERDELQGVFAAALADGPPVILGDIIITQGVTAREASEQGKTFHDHMAHLVVHGLLHLLGFDHIEDDEAHEMESHEQTILASLGIADPYRRDN